jgi:hypothetical protein
VSKSLPLIADGLTQFCLGFEQKRLPTFRKKPEKSRLPPPEDERLIFTVRKKPM